MTHSTSNDPAFIPLDLGFGDPAPPAEVTEPEAAIDDAPPVVDPDALTRDQLHALCTAVFPMRSHHELGVLEYIELAARPVGHAIVLRLITWDVNDETGIRSIRDVKEQEVWFPAPSGPDAVERTRCFLAALANVLRDALASPLLETSMPHELLNTVPLARLKGSTQEAFEKALRARSRLGRFLER